ncbi:Aim17p RNJ42_04659 [Nakaseomyces bracarensis]|uniref:Aim17p n=1 Tax=Nakaseomyces bracarensis TaxID=273131 RepID=UPI00387292B4
MFRRSVIPLLRPRVLRQVRYQSNGKILDASFTDESTTVTFVHESMDPTKDSGVTGHDVVPEYGDRLRPFTVCFNNIFLRDASKSPQTVDPVSGQRLITTGELLDDHNGRSHTVPRSVKISEDGTKMEVNWSDGDSYAYPLDFFFKYKGSSFLTRSTRNQMSKHKRVIWNRDMLTSKMDKNKDGSFFSFDQVMEDDKLLYRTLVNLQQFGITFIRGMPNIRDETDANDLNIYMIRKLGERIGPLRKTFYGEDFDITNQNLKDYDLELPPPHDNNIPFENIASPLHMDLQFLENVPGYKILHSLKNESENDTNIFVDSFYAARNIRETDNEAYEALQHVPINYTFKNKNKRYFQSKPLIEEYESNEHNTLIGNYEYLVKCVNYSPPFQAPFTYGIYNKLTNMPKIEGIEDPLTTSPGKVTERLVFRDFLRGLQEFERIIHDHENQFRINLPENTAVLYNNRRILHTRTNKNTRQADLVWFKACYFDLDTFKSKLKFLEESFEKE